MNNILKNTIQKFLRFYQRKILGLFSSITIETYGYCNRKCKFCFNSDYLPNREEGIMKEELWKKIIDELSELNFAGRISPHFYGEPLLDKRIFKFISYARQKCPHSYLRFSSNGDLLNEEVLLKLIKSGVDKLLVTNYDDYEKKELIKLAKKYPDYIIYRNYKDINMVNRGGEIFNKKSKVNRPCLRPSMQLVINWKGNALLCCNDYYEEYIFGNVKNKSLLEIWKSKKFEKYREKLKKEKGRERIDLCKNCDL